MREPFGDATHLKFGNTEHFGHFSKCTAGLKRGEAADNGGVLRAKFFEDQIHHVILAVVRKIHVYIRQFAEGHSILIEKTAEIQIEADGANVADAEAIASQRIGRAAASDPFDAASAAFLENIPYDQEIFLVADVGDDG